MDVKGFFWLSTFQSSLYSATQANIDNKFKKYRTFTLTRLICIVYHKYCKAHLHFFYIFNILLFSTYYRKVHTELTDWCNSETNKTIIARDTMYAIALFASCVKSCSTCIASENNRSAIVYMTRHYTSRRLHTFYFSTIDYLSTIKCRENFEFHNIFYYAQSFWMPSVFTFYARPVLNCTFPE